MSKHVKYVPKHRGPAPVKAPRKALRNTLVLSGIAAGTTGTVVAGGVVSTPDDDAALTATAAAVDVPVAQGADVPERPEQVSRSDSRRAADPAKEAALASADPTTNAVTHVENIRDKDPREIGHALMLQHGWDEGQWSCLDSLWTKESNWRVNADNPSSSAYGIPQSLPGSKMASAGSDWATNPVTQITWGLGYIEDRYGSPCAAWSHSRARNWY